MANEKLFTVYLKDRWINRPKLKRKLSSTNAIRDYFSKHMKVSEIKISSGVNEALHIKGTKWVPSKIQVKAIQDGDLVNVLLPDEKLKPKETKKTLKQKLFGKGDQKEKLSEDEKQELEEFKKKKKDTDEPQDKKEDTKKEQPKTEETASVKKSKESDKPKIEEEPTKDEPKAGK